MTNYLVAILGCGNDEFVVAIEPTTEWTSVATTSKINHKLACKIKTQCEQQLSQPDMVIADPVQFLGEIAKEHNVEVWS